jgi:hypothetical protein
MGAPSECCGPSGPRSGSLGGEHPCSAGPACAHQWIFGEFGIGDRSAASRTASIGTVVEPGQGQLDLVEESVHRVHGRELCFLLTFPAHLRCGVGSGHPTGFGVEISARARVACGIGVRAAPVFVMSSWGPLGLHAPERTPAVRAIS